VDAALNWLWQGITVAAAAALLLRLLDRARAQTRYLLCGVALLAIAALPLVPTLGNTAAGAIAPPLPAADATTQSTPRLWSADAPVILAVPDAWWTQTPIAIIAWAAWLAFQATRTRLAVVRVRRARARAVPVGAAVERRFPAWMQVRDTGRRPRLVVSSDIRAAAVLGAGPPLIALAPSLFDRLTDEDIDRLIMHERAHVQRRDDWTALAQLAARAIVGWHPGYRWIERRLQIEREIACDEAVVSITGSAKAYAACLVKLASLMPPRAEPLMTLAALSSPRLSTRVARIVSPSRSTPRLQTTAVATLGIASLMSLTIALGTTDGVVIATAPATAPNSEQPPVLDAASRIEARPAQIRPPTNIAASTRPSTKPATSAAASERSPVEGSNQAHSTALEARLPAAIQPPQPPTEPPVAAIPMLDRDPLQGRAAVLAASIEVSPPLSAAPDTRTPWATAADAGVAIGRGSKKAGVATAGFFTRVGKRLADTF
jgi:beta-lactamase regulating signal transducer with metallopeptidase domain